MGFFSKLFKWDDKAPPNSQLPSQLQQSELGLDAKAASAVLAELDIDKAIAAHENWKARLQKRLDGTSDEVLDPAWCAWTTAATWANGCTGRATNAWATTRRSRC